MDALFEKELCSNKVLYSIVDLVSCASNFILALCCAQWSVLSDGPTVICTPVDPGDLYENPQFIKYLPPVYSRPNTADYSVKLAKYCFPLFYSTPIFLQFADQKLLSDFSYIPWSPY